jgi:nickel/cobalt exporter
MRRLLAVLIGLVALAPLPALAHPHIFIDAKAAITFNDQGEVVSIHNDWVFDEAYSAWSIQGLDTNGDGKVSREELQPLADDNMNGLADYEYYTFAGEGTDPNLKFGHGSNPSIEYDGKQTTLHFDVALAQPYAIRKSLELSIDDPEYYVAITFKDKSDIQLINAPSNCSVAMQDAKEMPPELADALYALPPDVTKLPPELAQAMRGMQGEVLINCPGGSATGKGGAAQVAAVEQPAAPATALDAVNALGAASAPEAPGETASIEPPGKQALANVAGKTPFGVAPNEPGLNWPLPGVLGDMQSWVRQQDAAFYRALSQSLSALKTNWTAFWLLGGLSFLYGIIHAAGPGHGKVVIASYMFANEAQVRRGILLSFVSAMLQSLVAIAFVLVAASVLGMTAMAMADAANWIGVLSYGMIVLLGLWLVLRKIFGWGHRHDHDVDDYEAANTMQTLARRHMGAPAHALAAGGPQLTSFAVAGGVDAYGRMPGHAHYGHGHGDDAHDEHGHAHVVTPAQLRGSWREQLGVVLAVGVRPCSGALIVLAFAWSQGLLMAGIIAVLLMGVGTAITTGVLAALAVWFKGAARTLAKADNAVTARVVWWAELAAAVAVMAVGVVLVLASI